MQYVEDPHSSTDLPHSELERILMATEGLTTTHIGSIHIFPAAPITNTPVQTDRVSPLDSELYSKTQTSLLERGDSHIAQFEDRHTEKHTSITTTIESETNVATDVSERTTTTAEPASSAVSTSSVTTETTVTSHSPDLKTVAPFDTVSVEVQTEPVLIALDLGDTGGSVSKTVVQEAKEKIVKEREDDSEPESFASATDEEDDASIGEAVMKRIVEVMDDTTETKQSAETTEAKTTRKTEIEKEDKNTSQPEVAPASNQTERIETEDRSSQSREIETRENQTEDAETAAVSVTATPDQTARDAQTDEITTSVHETQIPFVSQNLAQTEVIPVSEACVQTRDHVTVGVATEEPLPEAPRASAEGSSQTDVVPLETTESQTESPSTQDDVTQTNLQAPDVSEVVPRGREAPGARSPPDGVSGVESESQTDITQSIMLQLIHQSTIVTRYGDKAADTGRQAARSDHEAGWSRQKESDSKTDETRSFEQSGKMQFANIFGDASASSTATSHLTMETSASAFSHEKSSDLSPSEPGSVQFPDFLDAPGDLGAAGVVGARDARKDSEVLDSGEGTLPDLIHSDERRSSGTSAEEHPETEDSASEPGRPFETDRNRNKKSQSRIKLSMKSSLEARDGSGQSGPESGAATEASGGILVLSSERESELISTGLLTDPGALLGSAQESEVLSGMDTDPMRLMRSVTAAASRRPPYVLRYSRENEKLGDFCTFFCRLCLPPYVVLLAMLAIACLVSLTEPDELCCFENHYPSTFGVMMTYPNGRPPF